MVGWTVSVMLRCRIVVDGFSCEELGVISTCWSGSWAIEASWDASVIFWFLCGPFAARGATEEVEYSSRWLGGTGEHSAVGKKEAARSAGRGVEIEMSPKRASG